MFFQDATPLWKIKLVWSLGIQTGRPKRCPMSPWPSASCWTAESVMNEPAFPPLFSWESKGAPPPKKAPHLFSTQEIHSLQAAFASWWFTCGLPFGSFPNREKPLRLHPTGWSLKVPGNPPTEAPWVGGWSAFDVNRRWDVGWLLTTEREGGCCWPLLGFLGASFSGMMIWYLLKNGDKILLKHKYQYANASISWHISDVSLYINVIVYFKEWPWPILPRNSPRILSAKKVEEVMENAKSRW